jgi:hypothetical protein
MTTTYETLKFWFSGQSKGPFKYSFTMPELNRNNLENIKEALHLFTFQMPII